MAEDASELPTTTDSTFIGIKSGTQFALALTVLALVLSANSIINDSWIIAESEIGVVTTESNGGLSDFTLEACIAQDCDTTTDTWADAYSDCKKDMKGASSSDIEKTCGDLKDMHNAGYICLLYTSPSPRDRQKSRMPSSA